MLITDTWMPRSIGSLCRVSDAGRRAASRFHGDIPGDRVRSFNGTAFVRWLRSNHRSESVEDVARYYLREGRWFGTAVRDVLASSARKEILPRAFFTYSTGAFEAIEYLADVQVPTLVDQIDPARTEETLVQAEVERWPGWARAHGMIPEEYFFRLEREWDLATRVVVNSEWSRRALIAQGVAAKKVFVLPLAYEAPAHIPVRRERGRDAVTVLFLGQVVLRKGIQYLVEAAEQIGGESIRFVVAGPIGISDEAIRRAPSNMTFLGAVPRSDVTKLYSSADLFVFPTISDGFGITQLEAMAHGLPVIATPNCGEVVRDGIDGRIVPPADSEALAAAIVEVASDCGRRAAMSSAAAERVSEFSINVLSDRLEMLLDEIVG